MDSEAATTDRIAPARRAVPACLLAMMLLAISLQVPGPGTGEEVGKAGRVDVLFHFTAEDYIWGEAVVNATLDAVSVSRDAAYGVNKAFVYETNTSGTRVEIGGLAPPPGAWSWTLLKWGKGGSWEAWNGAATDLRVGPGESIAWCPGDQLPPTPDPLSKYPWPMFRASASRRGESLSPPPQSNLTYWKTSVGMLDRPVLSSPCVANGKLFFLAGDSSPRILCLREDDGAFVWARDLGAGGGPQLSSPAYARGLVILGTRAGKLLALNATNGDIVWEYNAEVAAYGDTSPAVVGGRVLFSGGDGSVHCLDLAGRVLWKSSTGAPINYSSPAVLTGAPMGDRLLAGTADCRVFCLNLSDGAELWNRSLGDAAQGDSIFATPAISREGYAFVPVVRGPSERPASMALYSLYLKDGVVQWNATYSPSISSPALAGGGLFLGTGTEFVGHHPDRGTRSWGIPLGPVDSSPAVAGGYVYFTTGGDNGTVACARVGGRLEWTLRVNDDLFPSPVVADGRLFVCSANGEIQCIGRPPDARLSGRLSVPGKLTAGANARIEVSMKNSGEVGAVFTAFLTVDGNRTSLKTGPLELAPGASKAIAFDWKATSGRHELGISLDGANITINETAVEVQQGFQGCAIVYYIPFAAGAALLVPLIARSGKGKRGDVE